MSGYPPRTGSSSSSASNGSYFGDPRSRGARRVGGSGGGLRTPHPSVGTGGGGGEKTYPKTPRPGGGSKKKRRNGRKQTRRSTRRH